MKQLIASCLKVDRSVKNVFEWHVWMDGGCTGNQLGQYAIQFVACLKEEVERIGGDDKEWVESGQKMETPYGQRLEWLMPNGTPFALHLKDPNLVKRGKRWSQVMYMYYLLQFRVPRDHPRDMSASFILTTDADVIFTPKDVQALAVLLSRNKRVGACCGRTYPKGSGPVFWYQVFDYAVGHWFQKTSEHVLGTVLCCPGCFSLYGDAHTL
jgi:chitin synthase